MAHKYKSEEAFAAVRAFNAIRPQLESFCRIITGDPGIIVEATEGINRTDGVKIYIRPPLGLGVSRTHERSLCGSRDDDGRMLCDACDKRELIDFSMFHEVSHVLFKSNRPMGDSGRRTYNKYVNLWHPKEACNHARGLRTSPSDTMDCLNAASLLNGYLPLILNGFEDTRVNEMMFKDRVGLRRIFETHTHRILQSNMDLGGIEYHCIDLPLDTQFVLGSMALSMDMHLPGLFVREIIGAMKDPEIVRICSLVKDANDPDEIFGLSYELFVRANELGYCVVEKCAVQPVEEMPSLESDCEGPGLKQKSDGGQDSEEKESEEGSDEGASDGSESDASNTEESSDGTSGDGEVSDNDVSGSSEDVDSSDSDSSSGSMDSSVQDESDGREAHDSSDIDSPDSDSPKDPHNGDAGDNASDSPGEHGAGEDETRLDEDERGGMEIPGERPGKSDPEASISEVVPDDGMVSDEQSGDFSLDLFMDELESEDEGNPWDIEAPESKPEEERVGVDFEAPSDPLEAPSGADLGHGTPTDIASALKAILVHDVMNSLAGGSMADLTGAEEGVELNSRLKSLLYLAINQSDIFDMSSMNIAGIEEIPFPFKKKMSWYGNHVWRKPSESEVARYAPEPGALSRAILITKRAFEDNRKSATDRNRRSGRINASVLGRRAPLGDDRLFGHKHIPKRRSYGVVMAIDVSGSMGSYGRISKIKRAAYAQAELLAAVGIKFTIFAYSGGTSISGKPGEYVYIQTVKKINEPWSHVQKAKLAGLEPVGANLDGHTMEYGRKLVQELNVTDGILVYYTDGDMPVENFREEKDILVREVKLMAQLGITCLGVGINTDSPKQYGLDTVRLDSDADVIKVVEQLERRLTQKRKVN